MKYDPFGTLIKEGQYTAIFVWSDTGVAYGKGRIFAHFKITEPGPASGQFICRFYNEPRKKHFLPRSHNLSLDYINVTGKRPPTDLRTPEPFLKSREVLVDVVTVKDRLKAGQRIRLPEPVWYSKIDSILELTAGHRHGSPRPPRATQPASRGFSQ